MTMPLLFASKVSPELLIVYMGVWFLQMGFHEGAHAYMADRLGDRMPRMMGKVTVNPFRHIEWNNPQYVISAVVMPLVTTMMLGLPMGMAWVQHSRMSTADEAKVAIAGPLGSFLVALFGVALFVFAFPMIRGDTMFSALLGATALSLVFISLLYAVFNIFPVPPLDGATVLYHFLPQEGRDFFDRIRPYGFFIIIGVFWLLPPLTQGRVDFFGWIFGPVFGVLIDAMNSAAHSIWG